MNRALLWKEWRRLRALRWTLVVIGLALPAAFSLAAWAASRGWGMRAFTGYSIQNILLEAVPAALWIGVWPLAAMVFVVQAFTADRADGTEAFLLDRAVSRRRIWLTRWTAALGSLAVLALAGLAMLLAFWAGYAEAGRSVRGLAFFAIPGLVLVAATTLAGLGATSLVAAPLPAFLLALLLTASPVLAGIGGTVIFPYASWYGIPLALLAACAIGLAMPLASWIAETQGEPAGRGRRLRAALVLTGALLLSGIGFVIVAPFFVAKSAPLVQLSVVAPSTGETVLVLGERGYRSGDGGRGPRASLRVPAALANGPAAFLVDRDTGRRHGFLAPEVQWAQWNATGTKLAVMDNARPFGSVGASRLRFLDSDGRALSPSVPEPDGFALQQGAWAGDRLVVVYGDLQSAVVRVDVLDPGSGRQTTVFETQEGTTIATLHAAEDGRLFLHTVEAQRGSGPATRADWDGAAWSLRPLDAGQAALGPPVLQGRGGGFSPALSPSGRYWVQRKRQTSEIAEIGSGATRSVPHKPHRQPVWMRDDSLVWIEWGEKGWNLFRLPPEESPLVWATGPERFPLLEVSPDGALAVIVLMGPDTRPDRGALLLEAGSSGPPRPLAGLAPFRVDEVTWAGPRTLAAVARGRLALHDVVSGKGTVVFGRR